MRVQTVVGSPDRTQLQAALAAEREALLAVVADVDGPALTRATRNEGWTVGQVLAHVLACDADLIELLGAVGRPGPAPPSGPRRGEHEQEAARWSSAECDALAGELRQRSERWRALLEGLEDAAFAMPARIWWRTEAAPLLEVAADWRGHDSQHAEDVRLAVEARGARVRE